METTDVTKKRNDSIFIPMLKMIIFSSIGIFIFFFEITINGKTSILPIHLANILVNDYRPVAVTAVLLLIAYGGISPFFDRKWRASTGNMVFTGFKVAGLIVTAIYMLDLAPAQITTPGMMPFLFEKLVLNLGLIVPIGAVGLTFLVYYGLIELSSVFLEPVMRRVWRCPGNSAVDAVASFVGSYSLGLLITNRMYLEKSYSYRQSVIIATGFSTVSVTFMVVVAKVMGLLDIWSYFFWTTLAITFAVTAITARIPPISRFDDTEAAPINLDRNGKSIWGHALDAGISRVQQNPSFGKLMLLNIRDGLKMTSVILPTGVSVGLLGLLLNAYTPIFDWFAWAFYPLLSVLSVPEAMLTAKAISASLVEMFFPTGMLLDAPFVSKYIFSVIAVSGVLFFAGSIPCILATEIPVKTRDLIVIWIIRVYLSIPFAVGAAYLAPI